jgi:hypothetical protein
MPEITTEELRKLAREKFGRDLTDAEVQRVARPLPALAPAVDRLLWWQSQLGETEPATIYSLSYEVRNEQ